MSGAFVRRAHAGSLEKVAWRRPIGIGLKSEECPWSEQFRGSPFLERAQELERESRGDRVHDAKRRIDSAKRELDDAKFEEKIASVEQKLLNWKHTHASKEKRAFAEKLAEARIRSFDDWVACFSKSPFYKLAMQLRVEDAQREVSRQRFYAEDRKHWDRQDGNRIERAQLEADLAKWQYEQAGFSKTASAALVKSARVFGASVPEGYLTSPEIPYHLRKKKYDKYLERKSKERPTGVGKSTAVGAGLGAVTGALIGRARPGATAAGAGAGALIGASAGLVDKNEIAKARRALKASPARREELLANVSARAKDRRVRNERWRTAAAYDQLLFRR